MTNQGGLWNTNRKEYKRISLREFTTPMLLDRIMPIPESGCWIWEGEVSKSHGYAIINGRNNDGTKERDYAHRMFYTHFKGPIAPGLTIDHLCRVRCCVNPHHLEAVTIGENVLRGTTTSAFHKAQMHCINGHEFTSTNTYLRRTKNGYGRQCKACKIIRRNSYNLSKMQRGLPVS